MGSWSARTKRSDDFAAPEWAGKRNHKGDRLLFFSLRGRPRGRSVLPRPNLEAISACQSNFPNGRCRFKHSRTAANCSSSTDSVNGSSDWLPSPTGHGSINCGLRKLDHRSDRGTLVCLTAFAVIDYSEAQEIVPEGGQACGLELSIFSLRCSFFLPSRPTRGAKASSLQTGSSSVIRASPSPVFRSSKRRSAAVSFAERILT